MKHFLQAISLQSIEAEVKLLQQVPIAPAQTSHAVNMVVFQRKSCQFWPVCVDQTSYTSVIDVIVCQVQTSQLRPLAVLQQLHLC